MSYLEFWFEESNRFWSECVALGHKLKKTRFARDLRKIKGLKPRLKASRKDFR